MASTAAMVSGITTWCAWPGRGESVAELNRLGTSYSIRTLAVVTDMHHRTELPLVDELRWVSPLHLVKKRMTERFSFLVHVASGAAIFTVLLRRRVALLHRTATCRPLFKP